MVVDHDGRILAQADPGPGEKIVVGPVNLGALREARRRRTGHAMLAHLRTEAYPVYRGAVFPPGRARSGRDLSYEASENATREAWERLR